MNQLIYAVLSGEGLGMWQRLELIQYSSLSVLNGERLNLLPNMTFVFKALYSAGDFGRHLTLHCPFCHWRLSGKTTDAYLLPSAGLSSAHLHIDGKSMASLQCDINITNDQFNKHSQHSSQMQSPAPGAECWCRKCQFSLYGGRWSLGGGNPCNSYSRENKRIKTFF